MKKSFIVILIIVLGLQVLTAQNNQPKYSPVGSWKFEAPYAPEGYTTGTINIGLVGKKDTITMSFTGSEYKISGENIKTATDSVLFSVYLQGQDIKLVLKVENETKMSGTAIYSEGEVPLTLTKVTDSVAAPK